MITIKTEKEIEIMREGGQILAQIMKELEKKVEPGVTTNYLNKVAEDLVFKFGGRPSFKGYRDATGEPNKSFPSTLCTSINEELVHCIPSQRKLEEGDIISLDLGILYPAPEQAPYNNKLYTGLARYGEGNGFHTDMAVTVPVGRISAEAQRLIRITKKALKRGIKKVRPGNTFGDIGNTIQRYVEGQGYNVVRELCGHGIGREIHEDPQIPNYGKRRTGPELVEGMVFCIEPMVAVGDWKIKKAKDNYGFQTKDNSLCAHFEHTLAVTKTGAEILTNLK